MDHVSATQPGQRRDLRRYLFRYRHLHPMAVALVALTELEIALDLLQQCVSDLPTDCQEAVRISTFLAIRLSEVSKDQ